MEPLDELYFTWLYSQVGSVRLKNPARTYWSLLRQLYQKEFVWLIPNDDNRFEDGRDLRQEFIESREKIAYNQGWMDLPCSMFEMLIGLSRRVAFEDDGDPRDWFWHLMTNIGLADYNDKVYNFVIEGRVNEVVDRINYRSYSPDGSGGLFPLKNPNKDQRSVELWYQLSAYLLELL